MDYYSLLTFVVVTSITPGPNNISSFIFSLAHGYKKVLPYIFGIISGTFLLLTFCGFLVDIIHEFANQISNYLKYLAGIYILFLAYKSLKINASISNKHSSKSAPTYLNGFILQMVNPKAIFYGVTMYTTFLVSLVNNYVTVALSAALLSMVTFSMVSIWALSGNMLLKSIKNPAIAKTIGIIMALVLVVFAFRVMEFF